MLEGKLCECGCLQFVSKPGNRFIHRHNLRGQKSWNKGLTKETDERVAKSAIVVKRVLADPKVKAKQIRGKDKKPRKSGTGKYSRTAKHIAIIIEIQNRLDVKVARSAHMKADLNPNWKGGIGKLPYPFNFNNKLKELIRERDGYICQLCSKTQEENNQRLSIHHIDYDKDNLDPKNLISLCRSCNCKVNYNREYWTEFFKRRMTNA